MSKKLLLLLVSLLLLSPRFASAQSLAKSGGLGKLSKVAVQNVPAQKALDEARLFYASRPDAVNEARGSGYKPFKRMEWFLENRLNEDGTYPEGALWNAFIDKQEARQRGDSKIQMMPAAGTWTSLGPYGLSNPGFPASGTNASSGGRMLDFAFDPTDVNVIYAAAASGGLWKSTDDGLSWAPLDDKLPVLAVSCVVVDPNDANTLYIGTGEGYGNIDAVNGVGVLQSTDGGASWSNTGLSFAYSLGRKVNELIMDPSNSSVLIAATSVGVYRTTDGGTNWTQTLTASPAFDLAIDASNSNNVFVTVSGTSSTGGIYKSTNNGASWTQLTTANGLPAASTHKRISMDIGVSNSQVLYASFTNTTDGLQGVYKTTDGGSNWALTTTTPTNYLGTQGWYDNVLAVDPNDEDIVYVGGVQAYKTTDGGATWASVHNNIHVDYHALAFHNGNVYAGNDGGVYKTSDGGTTWTNLSLNGLVTHQYYKFGTSFNDANTLMGGAQDNGLNQYSGSPDWTKRRGGDGMEVIYDYTDATSMIVYGENQNGSRLRSIDGGATWSGINSGAPSGPWVTPLEMDSSVPTTLYTIGTTSGDDKLYKTTDSGSNWSLLFDATEDLDKDIKVAPNDNQVIYVLGATALYYSSDGGGTFTKGTGLPTSSMNYVAVDPTNAQIAYITRGSFNSGSHLFKTTNGGVSWTNVTGTLPNIPANTVAIDPDYPSNVYVGNDLGVYLSTDAGATWSDWTDDLPNVVVDELEIHASSRLIRAATHGRGIWSAPLYEPPTPTVNAGNDASVCIGGSANLNGTVSGGSGSYTFAWTVQTGPNTSSTQFNNAALEDPTFTPALAGVYTLRLTVDDGVVTPVFDDVEITVNALPTAIVSGNATICAGASTTISAALTGTGPWNLTWSDGVTQNGVTTSPATRNVSPTSNTTYTVSTISDANCTGTSSGSAVVTINPLPTATVSGDATICAGASTTISAALTGTGPWNLTWSDGATQNGVTSSPATRNVSPTSNTTYTVSAISDANCTGTSSGSATVTVNPLPTVSISGNDPVVTGTTHTYSANTSGPSNSESATNGKIGSLSSIQSPPPTTTYSWSVTNGTINGSNTNSTVSVTAGAVGTMEVSVTVTDGTTSCSNNATKNVTVNSNTLAANAGSDATICFGASTNLNGTASGGDGSYSFAWTVQTGPNTSSTQFNNATLEDPTFTPTLAGVYTLRFTVDDGVVTPVFDDVEITVKALPTATVSGNATICAGGSTTISAALTGTGPWNLTWSDGATQNGVTSSPATRNVSPASNTTYTVTTISDANCTGTSSGSATVTVNPLPTVSISGNDPVVTGTTHTYTANTNASNPSYSWSVTGGTINGSNTNNTVSVTAGGVGTMIVSLGVTDGTTSCSNNATKNVTVNSNTLAANAGNDATICLGGSANLNGTVSGGSGSYTFAWTVQTGPNTSSTQFNNATVEDPTFTPTLAGVYTLRFTVDDGVVTPVFDEVEITVNALPTATVSGNATICAGGSTTISAALTGTGPWNLTWSDGATQNGVTTSPATRNVSPTSNTTYTVTAISDANCTGTASGSAVVTVNPLPTVSISGNDPVVTGTTHTYTANTNASSPSYTWSVTNGSINGSNTNNTASVTAGGVGTMIVSLSVTDGTTSCSNSATKNVTVNANTLIASAGADKGICPGSSVQIGGSPTASGGTAPYTYSWTPTTGLNDATLANPTASPTSATTYTVQVTDNNGATATDQVVVTINPTPVANAGADKNITSGQTVQIGGSPTASGGTAPYTYSWTPTTGLSSATVANPNASPTSATTYTVVVTDAKGCTASDQVIVNVAGALVVNAGVDQEMCSGSSVQIGGSPTASGGIAPYSYSWTPTTGLNNATLANPTTSTTSTRTYTVLVTDANGATASDQVVVTVNAKPTANAGADKNITSGQTVQIGGSPTASGGTAPYTYSWTPITGLSSAIVANPNASPASTTTYTVVVTDAKGCTASDQVIVNVASALIVNAGADKEICTGSSVQIGGSPTASGGTTPYTYTWTPTTGLSSSTIANPTASPTVTTTYTVQVKDKNGVIVTDQVKVSVNPKPVANAGADKTIISGQSVQIGGSPTGSGGTAPYTYSWTPTSGLDNATAANPNASPTAKTTYTVVVTDAKGCTASDQVLVTVVSQLAANAGVDRSIVVGAPTTLGGSPAATGGIPPLTYMWSPATDLSNASVANPIAQPLSTTTYTLTVTDAASNTVSDQVVVTVLPAVFLSNKVTLKRTVQTTPTGDVHSNGTLIVEAGRPSTYNSNLTAIGAITIQKDNTINGNVKSQTSISNFGIINGTKTITPVANVALPTLNYSAGGSSLTVPQNGTLTVTPGSYNTITINTGSTLKLMSGQYFINELRYNSSRATIEIDLTSGNPVKINVVKKLQLGAYAVMQLLPNGDTDSKLVTINTMESNSITFGHAAYLLGSFIAPKAKVTLGADSQLRGVLCANEMVIDKDCLFLPHGASTSLAGPGKLTKTAGEVSELNNDDSPVTNYELAQNYPNPFNPETTIRFALPEAGRAVVTVYSLTGQVVKHLINTDLAGGRYQVLWNGRNDLEAVVAGGIYFYRLIVHGENGEMKFTQTHKLTFVK